MFSIWKWVQKYSRLTDRFVVGKRKIKKIFVDETLLKINGQDYWTVTIAANYLNLTKSSNYRTRKNYRSTVSINWISI